MDSFCSLFDPSDGTQSHTTKKKKGEQDNVKKKTDTPKGRRRGRKSAIKNETLPEESSFLCEPELGSEVMVRDASYFDSYIKRDDESPCNQDNKPKRRNSNRKYRRRKSKISPAKEGTPTEAWVSHDDKDGTHWNNRSTPPRHKDPAIGRHVNDISTLPSLMQRLEKVSLNELPDDSGDDWSSDDKDDSGVSGLGRLPPEPRFGNVEYKLQLVDPPEKRFQHLVTQLKWRLASGGGNAVYLIGVRDCGQLRGLSPSSLRASLRTLRLMSRALGASIAHVCVRRVASNTAVAEVYIKRLPDTQQSVELRVAVMGANEAGKSTLIGVLTQGELDNGFGSARLNMFRHLHEVKSGRTSSLSHEILGFDAQGNVVNYGCSELMTAERIGERSAKLVCFLDLAGHSKYQKTTRRGLTAYCPHVAMLLISATAGITGITSEHLTLLLALEVPFFVVITKCELANSVPALMTRLEQLLAPKNMKPLLISDDKSLSRVVVAPQKLILDLVDEDCGDLNSHSGTNKESELEHTIPVFPVSCVRGNGLASLHAYLLALQPPSEINLSHVQDTCEFQIDEIFHTSGDGDAVVGGFLARGVLCEGDELLLGPLACGSFRPASVRSVRVHRRRCARAAAGHSASVLLRAAVAPRAGMVLLSKKSPSDTKQETTPDNRKSTRRKSTNLLTDILTAENILSKPNIDAVNVYNTGNEIQSNCKRKNRLDVSGLSGADDLAVGANVVTGGCGNDLTADRNDSDISDDVVAEDPYNPRGCLFFQAVVEVLQHSTVIGVGFQCTVYSGNVTQTAVIEGIMTHSKSVRSGERAPLLLRLLRCPEYLVRGRRLLLTAGHGTRAIGRITQVFPYIP